MKPLFTSILISLLFCTSQAAVTNIVSLTAVAYVQNSSKDSGTVTVTAPPVQKRVSTKDLLAFLAEDVGGLPSDARLALISSDPTSAFFAVVDKNLNIVVNLENYMTFSTGWNLIASGKSNNETGLMAPTMQGLELATVTYDDTWNMDGPSIQFSFRGLLTGSVTDSLFVEKQSGVISSAVGEGTYQGIPLVLKATLSFHGTGRP